MVKRVLVVDDEAPILELLKDILAPEGYVVDTALNAESALAMIRERIYDAALLDFNLPDMDGVMLHQQIRRLDEELAKKCVFMSGFVQSDDNMSYYSTQSGGFIGKPFDIAAVLGAVREVLASDEAGD